MRLGRRQLIGVGALGAVVLIAPVVGFGPIVRARVAAEAERRHLHVRVGGVRPGWFAVGLKDVSVEPVGVPSTHVHVDDLRVGFSAGLHVSRVDVRGAQVALDGSPETIRDEWERWRGGPKEPPEPGGRGPVAIEAMGVAIRWADGDPSQRGAEMRGIAFSRDARGTKVRMTDGRLRAGQGSVEWSEAEAEADAKGLLVRLHAVALTIGWAARTEARPTGAPDPTSALVPAPPPVIARAARPGRRARPSPAPPPPEEAGAPLVPLPDLHAMRGRAGAISALLAERVQQGAEIGVDSLTWRLAQDSDRVALTFGPGPLAFTRSPTQLELRYSTERHAAGTPLAVRAVLPTEASDLVLTVEGGPVSLPLLGVREQAAGLVDVDQATLAGRARVVLSGDGSSLTFDLEGGARGLSLNHPRLALDTIRGLDVGLRARGALTATGEVRVDDFGAAVGALQIVGSGTLDQKPDRVAGGARFEIPSAPCQSLLDSLPSALLPALQGTKISGTFGARGHFAFDTRSLDDLDLKYDVADRCRLTQVPAALRRERFEQPFVHRIYLPDGTTADETTGPGTPDWTPLDQISPYMQTAVLTTEDGAFPKHHGYNHAAIRASIIANLKARRFVRGASTITMQLAKNLFLSRDKTLSRKLEEVVLTDYLEQTFSKDEILELYLNVIEFGPSVYGIAQAAEYYFGRAPAELDLAECLFLSSILPAPLRYGGMRDGEQPSDGWMRTLHMFMEVAHKRGLLTDAELAEGEGEVILFWHGGPHPSPRTAVRGHAATGADGGDGADIPDPFESLPERP